MQASSSVWSLSSSPRCSHTFLRLRGKIRRRFSHSLDLGEQKRKGEEKEKKKGVGSKDKNHFGLISGGGNIGSGEVL